MKRGMTTPQFIQRAIEHHKAGDGTPLYDYTKSEYTKSAIKLIITCRKPNHGDFEQTPNNHLSGHGCKKCANELLIVTHTLTHDTFIKGCEEKYPNLIDYTNTKYEHGHKKTEFKCKICETVYMRAPGAMLSKETHGCPICIGTGFSDTRDTFITKANIKHTNKFNYDLVEYVNSMTKVKIKCPEGHIFEQTPSHHLNGDGCRKCRGYYRTQDDFEAESKEKFPSMFDYSKTKFVDMGTAITLICSRGHEFETVPAIHLRDDSKGCCRECAHINIALKNSYTQAQWIELAIAKHGNTYQYHKVSYVNSQTKVCIVCPTHGEFQAAPTCHLGGTGCPSCGFEKIAISKTYTESEFTDIFNTARILHNDRYTYTRIFRDDGRLMIEMSCPSHGVISQRLDHHLHGHACMKCVANYSKQQIQWLNYCSISRPGIVHAEYSGEYKIPGTGFMADGFHADTNTVYEYQGDFWHGNPSVFNPLDINPRTNTTYGFLFERTQKKIEDIKRRGYNVVEVWEREWETGKNAVVAIQKLWKRRHTVSP